MRLMIQRVLEARVQVGERTVAQIGAGLLVLVGVGRSDTSATAARAAETIAHLRLFADAAGKMNRSALDINAPALIVPEFTLVADTTAGRRPDFAPAMPAQAARQLFDALVAAMRATGLEVTQGEFQAHMHVASINDGPVTFVIEV